MKKHNEKHGKKIRNLVAFCSLCAILLSVSTYAWFIGMTKVSVDRFEINVATTEGLFLSMDGVNWYYNLDAKNTAAYANNANVWADETGNKGLIPMSTVGDMDNDSSRMKLFEKASFTAVPGGYRLLSSRVDNYSTQKTGGEYVEGKGYVAFDLFVKNDSGVEYYANNDPLNEEAIYLTDNSVVKVASNGEGGQENSGIENSVRVAFVQIGRVKGTTTDASTITGIKCADTYTEADQGQNKLENRIVTSICRNAQIWEPNDKDHVKNAINWYQTSCLKRKAVTGDVINDVTLSSSYETGACQTVADDTAYPTYAVSRAITVNDEVNLYDGPAYNTFASNSVSYDTYVNETDTTKKAGYKLVDFPYFTDTDKVLNGNQRKTFMTLAPNSITKLRVYIYIEGQDIDNYDFAQLGKVITVNFGFTKERYEQADINGYDGPNTNITPATTATVAP